ncbi:hypothetical protein BC833DRAFT_620115 [Globomyces pollinis-pini]|nr:hypothetical protein BC833DRAFT_620115 [Globomyces pollinis-pini]
MNNVKEKRKRLKLDSPLQKIDIYDAVVKVIISLWLLSGLALLTTIILSIIVSQVYESIKQEDTNSILLFTPLYGGGLLAYGLIQWLTSILTTFLKLLRYVWTASTIKFSLWIRSKIKYVLTIRQPKVGRVLPTSGTEDDLSVENSIENIQAPTHRKTHRDHHRQEAGSEESLISTSTGGSESDLRIEKQTDLIVYIIVFCIAAIPMLAISIGFGYWILLSYLTMCGSIISLLLLISSNFLFRIHRATHILPDLSDDGLLIPSFVSLTGFDDGHYLHFSIAKKATFMGVAGVISSFSFTSSSKSQLFLYIGISVAVLGIITMLSVFLPNTDRIYNDCYSRLNGRYFYNGNRLWPALLILIFRTIAILVSFSSLLYFKTSFEYHNSLCVAIFVITFILRDFLHFVRFGEREIRFRYHLFLFFHLVELGTSIWSIILDNHAISIVLWTFTILNVSYKDPNCVVMKTRFNSSKMLRKKRYLRVIFNLLGVTVLASLIIGLMAGTNSYFAVLSAIADNENHKVRVVPPFCHTVIEGLKIVDYVKLSQVMYQPTPANFNGYPKLKNFTEVQPPTVGSVTHRFFHHQISNLTVISVRGTKSFNDNLEDLYMYAAPALLTASTYFGTFVQFWPVELVAHLVYYIIRFGQNSAPLEYWEVLGKEIDLLQADGRAVVITGHSLGGALAGVLAAKYQIPGIGVCAPGLGYQTVTYGFTIESLVANFVNIIPNHDVVTMVDIQYGNLQSIPCYGKSPLDCHMINRTLGVIESFCGST